MITEQLPTPTRCDEVSLPAEYELSINKASLDKRVEDLAKFFMEVSHELDVTKLQTIAAVAAEYTIFPDDVTERACFVHILRKMDEVTDGEA